MESMVSHEPFHLPNFGSDHTVAIFRCSGAVLVLKHFGHRGRFQVFPGGRAHPGESLETACARTATEALGEAAAELASQLGSDELSIIEPDVSVLHKVGAHPWSGGTYHYFLATSKSSSLILDPMFQLEVDRERHKMGVWMPYEWVALDDLSKANLRPDGAIDICRQLLGAS